MARQKQALSFVVLEQNIILVVMMTEVYATIVNQEIYETKCEKWLFRIRVASRLQMDTIKAGTANLEVFHKVWQADRPDVSSKPISDHYLLVSCSSSNPTILKVQITG